MLNNSQLRSQFKKERRLLGLSGPVKLQDDLSDYEYKSFGNAIWAMLGTAGLWIIIAIILLISSCTLSHAQDNQYTDEQIVNAIYIAEGGSKTRHPYGILAKYKKTTPRQACFNTVRNKRKQWVNAGRPGSFIAYLGNKYCPIGASNDPRGLNRNWVKNVTTLLERGA